MMRHDQAVGSMPGLSYGGTEEESVRRSRFGPLVRIVLGLLIAVDISLLVPPLYYGTVSPCHMLALSNASRHSGAVDEEIGLSDEIARDVYYVSVAWTRTRQGFASCAGDIGGRTLTALAP